MLEEGPAHLYDALASILGLDELVAAQERLAEPREDAAVQHPDDEGVVREPGAAATPASGT